MPTFGNIDGEESATVTFTVAAVSLTRNSSAELQEILCLGDPDTTNAIAAVLAGAPASTAWGLVVRQQGYSTTVNVSSLGGAVIVRSSAADMNVTVAGYSTTVNVSSLGGTVLVAPNSTAAPASNDTGVVVRQVGYSTTINVSSLAGAVIVRSSAANFLASVYQSTAADLNVTVAGYSTTVNVSSLGGTVLVAPASTLSTAFFPVQISDGSSLFVSDSTNRAIRVNVVAGSAAGDTTVTVTPASSGATGFYAVRLSDGSTFVTDSTQRAIRVTSVDAGGSTQVSISQVSTAAPASNDTGVVVRQVGYSTTVNVSSLAGAVIVRSSAADMNVTVAGYSTTVNVSSLGGTVAVTPASSNATAFYAVRFSDGSTYINYSTTVNVSSLAGVVNVQQNSTVWQVQAKIQDSSAVGFIGTTTRPTTAAQGLVVRQVLNDLLSTCFSTIGNGSTSATVVSSQASPLRIKVYAYSITSTAQAINTLSFASSLANPLWTVQMQSVSSGIAGANLAVSPPAWLFATESNSPLVFKVTGTTGTYHLSFSYFIEA